MHAKIISLIAVIILVLPSYLRAAEPPQVVVSIKPLHALIAEVMAGVATPELLLGGGESPHSFALRPSQAKLLADADIIFWIGPELESFLVKPLQSLGSKRPVVSLLEFPGLRLLPARSGGIWEAHHPHADGHVAHGTPAQPSHQGEQMHEHKHEHENSRPAAAVKARPAHQGMDPHLWLDPENAMVIARQAAAEMGRLFPAHRAQLAANAEALTTKLAALDAELHQELSALRGQPYVVFHDAYQYFEAHYGLSAAGAITLHPEQAPGAQRLRGIRKTIRDRQAVCVFAEPQFEPRLVATAVEGSGARQGVLDPLGVDLAPGPDAYFVLMRRLAQDLRNCLEAPSSSTHIDR